MKKLSILAAAASLTLLVLFGGCGFLSGTVFISQDVEGDINSSTDGAVAIQGERGDRTLDAFGGAFVDLTDNSEWNDIDIDGIEDICTRLTAINNSDQPVSGEVWVTLGDTVYSSIAAVEAAGGFRVFHGLALEPLETRIFECAETLELFENLDRLVDAVAFGKFYVWGRGDQETYDITYEAIYLGMHVTGSL